MTERTPAEVFPPGEFVKEELDARGWTQIVLAEVISRPVQFVNELIAGRKSVTPETAAELAEAFGTSAEFWMNLDTAYRLWVMRQKSVQEGRVPGEVARRARLYEVAPVKDMVKRGWIPATSDVTALEARLNEFFGCDILTEGTDLPMAARASTEYRTEFVPAQKAWAFRALQLARGVAADRFVPATFGSRVTDLRRLLAHEKGVRHAPKILASLGVRFVVVEHLPKSKIDGAALWLSEDQPVVALSMRFDRIDGFWFTLAHELAHVLYGDRNGVVDDDLDSVGTDGPGVKPEFELRADAWAANFLLKTEEVDKFVLRTRPYYSRTAINQFANRVKVHPGIIVGQLQRRKEVPYTHSRDVLVKVRDELLDVTPFDGWGHPPAHP